MKSYYIIFLFLVLNLSLKAQDNISLQATQKFGGLMNAAKTDSVYTLFSTEMKKAVSIEKFQTALLQIKSVLGKLGGPVYYKKQGNYKLFILPSEKENTVLQLSLDPENKVAGFFIVKDPRQPEDPASVTLSTPGAILKGTLSVPKSTGKLPVVLLISGSGPTDRDGNSALLNGKPEYLKLLSEQLTNKNIAVLRYDKRGIGASQSSKRQQDLRIEDFIDDAIAWIKKLKDDQRFSKVIVAGHSEGALIGMVAALKANADAFVSIAGPGFPIDQILKTQLRSKLSESEYKRAAAMTDSLKSGLTIRQDPGPILNALFGTSIQPFLRSLMQYDPGREITKLKMPVLLIQGSTDLQVEPENVQKLKKLKPDAQLILITGMNHVLKQAPADAEGNFATYSAAGLPLHPELSPSIIKFITNITAPDKK